MGKTILLADDSKTIRKAVEMALKGEEYQLVAVSSAAEVLPKCKEIKPSVVLLDHSFNDSNDTRSGLDICKEIRTDQDCKHLPIVYMHALMDNFDENEAYSAGANSHVPKPFECRELLSAIDEAISKGLQSAEQIPSASLDKPEPVAPEPSLDAGSSLEPEPVAPEPSLDAGEALEPEPVAPEPSLDAGSSLEPEPVAPEPSLDAGEALEAEQPIQEPVPDIEEISGLPEASVEELPEASVEDLPEASVEDLPEASVEELPEASVEDLPEASVEDLPEASEFTMSATSEVEAGIQDIKPLPEEPPALESSGAGMEDDLFDFDTEEAPEADEKSQSEMPAPRLVKEEEELPEPWKAADLSSDEQPFREKPQEPDSDTREGLEPRETRDTVTPEQAQTQAGFEQLEESTPEKTVQEAVQTIKDSTRLELERKLGAAAYEIIERIAWEVVPDLAEAIIRKELERLIQKKKTGE